MGLDMYLSEEVYISRFEGLADSNAEYRDEYDRASTIIKAAGLTMGVSGSVHVRATVMYWRKANAIHGWFVRQVQNDVDDCGRYSVSVDQLNELVARCRRVLAESKMESGTIINGYTASAETGGKFMPNIEEGDVIANPEIADKLLPTGDGFFFGSTAYNEWYVRELIDTVAGLESAMAAASEYPGFHYESSW